MPYRAIEGSETGRFAKRRDLALALVPLVPVVPGTKCDRACARAWLRGRRASSSAVSAAARASPPAWDRILLLA